MPLNKALYRDTKHIEDFKTSNFIENIQKDRLYIACLENSYLKGYITKEQLLKTSEILKKQIMASTS